MKDLKYSLSKILILKILIFSLFFQNNLFLMKQEGQDIKEKAKIFLQDVGNLAKELFGILNEKSTINLNDFDYFNVKVAEQWNKLISKVNDFDTDFNRNSLILTLNRNLIDSLNVLNNDLKKYGPTNENLNINLLAKLQSLDKDLKNARLSLSSLNKQSLNYIVIDKLLQIFSLIINKIRIDFSPDVNQLRTEIDYNYNLLFPATKNIANATLNKTTQELWNLTLLKIQKLVFLSGVESLICVAQNPEDRCKTKQGDFIYNIYDISVNLLGGISKLIPLYKNYDFNLYDELKKIKSSSEKIINQIKKIVSETKIDNKNVIGKNAKTVLEDLMKNLELLLKKIEDDFIGTKKSRTKEAILQDINTTFGAIFNDNSTEYSNDKWEKYKNKLWDKLLFEVGLFIKESGSEDYAKIFKNVKESLNTVFDNMGLSKTLKQDIAKDFKGKVALFDRSFYKPLIERLNKENKRVDAIYAIKPGTRDSKKILLTLIEKMRLAVEKYNQDWQNYFKTITFTLPHKGQLEKIEKVQKE